MDLATALKKYDTFLREDVIWSYEDADKYIYINEADQDLQKWRIEMPEPPDWARIEGFGKHARDQVFVYEQMPSRLEKLIEQVEARVMASKTSKDSEMAIQRKIHQEINKTIRNHSIEYRDEIKWIQACWYYRMFGKWMFICGKPVYISGYQWFYCNFWPLEGTGKLPQYRERDMKWFHAQEYAFTTTETVAYKQTMTDSGKIKYELDLLSDGTPRMVDVGYRTVFGTNNLKGRRVGDTSKTCCINYCIGTEKSDRINGIQGNLESTASDIYEEKLLYAYNRMPFFFVPEFPNLFINTGLSFTGYNGRSGLNSKIGYATSSRKEYYDQRRLDFYHADEAGKTRIENIIERHGVIKRCCTEGALIKGFMIYTSTAEDMEADAGILFEQLSYDSMFEERMANGQTKSGLLNVYFPIYESYAGYIDRYGRGITENPTPEQIEDMDIVKYNDKGEVMGAKEYLESVEADLLEKGDLRGLAQHQRQNPKSFRECFALAIAGNNFNTQILQDRINELKFQKDKKIRVGNFMWAGEPFKSNVVWVDTSEGKWEVSMFDPPQTNQSVTYDGINKMPRFDSGFIISADAYRFDEVDSYRESKGGIVVYEMFNPTMDGEKNDPKDYVSDRFIATYCHREATKEKFAEEVLKVALYYNALVYPEINVAIVQEFFIRHKFRGYLHFDVDDSGNKKKNCGFNTAGPVIKQKMFTFVDTWINLHAHRCMHRNLLEECLMIRGPRHTKDYDLFVAMCGALLGASSKYVEFIKRFGDVEGVEVSGFWGLG